MNTTFRVPFNAFCCEPHAYARGGEWLGLLIAAGRRMPMALLTSRENQATTVATGKGL